MKRRNNPKFGTLVIVTRTGASMILNTNADCPCFVATTHTTLILILVDNPPFSKKNWRPWKRTDTRDTLRSDMTYSYPEMISVLTRIESRETRALHVFNWNSVDCQNEFATASQSLRQYPDHGSLSTSHFPKALFDETTDDAKTNHNVCALHLSETAKTTLSKPNAGRHPRDILEEPRHRTDLTSHDLCASTKI